MHRCRAARVQGNPASVYDPVLQQYNETDPVTLPELTRLRLGDGDWSTKRHLPCEMALLSRLSTLDSVSLEAGLFTGTLPACWWVVRRGMRSGEGGLVCC